MSTAVGLLTRTTPFLLWNAAVYGATFVAAMLWMGGFGWLGVRLSDTAEVAALVCFAVAVVVPVVLFVVLRRYFLYLVQAAHIAAATTLLLDGGIPDGQGQVEYGRNEVKRLFVNVSTLFFVDRMVDRVLRRFLSRFVRLVDLLPLGGAVSGLARLASTVLRRSLTYVDEAIISYAIAQRSPNVFSSARHGIILYAQAYKPILAAAVRIWLLGRVAFVAALIIAAVPAWAVFVAAGTPGVRLIAVIGAVVLAVVLMKIVFEPFALIYTLVTYHRTVSGMQPDPVWDERLQSVSKEFTRLIGRARETAGGDPLDQGTVPPAPAPTSTRQDLPPPPPGAAG